jgi:5-methylcytosine-specific restriction endonuclease McrBC regulatory subunit McrC
MYKKSKKKKKNKVKVVKSTRKTYGLTSEEMFNLCSNFKVREDKVLVLSTSYKKY